MSKSELEQMLDIIRQMQCDIYALQSRLLKAQYKEERLAKDSSNEALLNRFIWASES